MQARELVLQAGVTYRVSVKLCAGVYCYKPVASNGVTVVPNPPETGSITVQFDSNENKVSIFLNLFGLVNNISVLITSASSKSLGKSAHMRRLARAFTAHIHLVWTKIKAQPKVRPLVLMHTSAWYLHKCYNCRIFVHCVIYAK